MRRAIALAKSRRTHPNPAVGAVVVDAAGNTAGEGAHRGPGTAHAEIEALEQAGHLARDGTLVVTLEPCAHHGRTPPCTDAIVKSGVTTVVAAITDPDAQVSGRGFAALEAAGIAVRRDVLSAEAEAVDPGYFHHRRTGRPLVRLKAALTLDGQIAAADGTSKWITGAEAREDAHRLRSRADGVVVGAGTVRADDPRLTVRLDGYSGPLPRPVVISGREPLPPTSAVLGSDPLVYSSRPLDLAAEVVVVPAGPDGVDMAAVAKDLGERQFLDVLVEGGPTLASSLVAAGLVDKVSFYYGAKLATGLGHQAIAGTWDTLSAAVALDIDSVTVLGADVRIDATVVR